LNKGYWEAHYILQHPVPGSGDTVAVSPESVKIKGANIELSPPGFKTMPVFLQKNFSGRFVVSKDGKRKGILFGDDFLLESQIRFRRQKKTVAPIEISRNR
jgi:hypothetical protein